MAANIASGNATSQSKVISLRSLIRLPQFSTDTLTGPGDTYAGKLHLVNLDLIEAAGGNTVFLSATDAGDPAYYDGDGTHPTTPGQVAAVDGLTTPQHCLRTAIYERLAV